jgi:DNA-binding transcriptional regulator YiaG
MKRKYKSEPLEAIYEAAKDMYEIGLLSEERMRHFDAACLAQPAAAPLPRIAKQKSAPARSGSPMYAQGT